MVITVHGHPQHPKRHKCVGGLLGRSPLFSGKFKVALALCFDAFRAWLKLTFVIFNGIFSLCNPLCFRGGVLTIFCIKQVIANYDLNRRTRSRDKIKCTFVGIKEDLIKQKNHSFGSFVIKKK